MTVKLIVFSGLSGAGKTTAAKAEWEKQPFYRLCSYDDVRQRFPKLWCCVKKVYRATITREQLAELLAGKSVEIFNRSDMVCFRINLESAKEQPGNAQ